MSDVYGPFPYFCPSHPAAQIRRSWDQNHYVLNGYPAGTGWKTNIEYACAECGRRLADEAPAQTERTDR